jgi:hypothetical protein
MFNKKGLSYIDWMISMGLFLLVVIMIFTFLRPGSTPEFQSSELFEMIESNFFQNTSWYTVSLPIAINKMQSDSIAITLKHNIIGDWRFLNLTIPTQYSNLDYDLSGLEVNIYCLPPGPCTTNTNTNSPYPGIYVTSIKNPTRESQKEYNIQPYCNGDSSNCSYVLGSTEYFTGLNLQSVLNLKNKNYENLKQEWKYPLTRDFILNLYYLNGSYIPLTAPSYIAPAEANIFVKEVNTAILNPDGTREQVIINMQIW